MTGAQVATETVGAQDQPPSRRRWAATALLGLALLAANVCVGLGLNFAVVVPILGLFLLVGLPTGLLMAKVDWRTPVPVERLGYSLVTTLLLLMFGGLLINTILPPLGLHDALGRLPVLVTADVLVAALLIWRRERVIWRPARSLRSVRLTIQEKTVTRVALASTVLGVIGANRLNNGTGDTVSVVSLGLVFLALLLVFLWRDRLDPGVITFVIYTLSLTMLLITSMRGWYTTGHDIQREFRVFELTKTNGNWSIARFRDPYNACLSITILPMMLWDVTKVHDPYVYKVFFQAMFALCPVLVYRLSLRFTTPTIGLIGLTYLLCYPTFSNDMPFENRQEIAFLYVLAILLIMTQEGMPLRQKRLWIAAFSLGMIVSHYSTASVFIATILALCVLRVLIRMLRGRLEQAGRRLRLPPTRLEDKKNPAVVVFGLVNVFVLLLGAVLWIGVITQTGYTISSTFSSAISSIGTAFSFNSKSSDVSYNLFSFGQPSSAQLLSEYRQWTLTQTPDRAGFYPLAFIDAHAHPTAYDITSSPSAFGTALDHADINVTDVNTLVHGGAAKLLQLLVLIGLIGALFRRDVRFRIKREPYLFAVATLLVLVAEVIVPVVSEDYGVLRAFMQGLLILSPILAYGSVIAFTKLGARWATRVSIALALFLFLSLSGLVPQLTGGYQELLSLDNSGLYYDIYYPHTQEIVAVTWLRRQIPPQIATSVQSEVFTDEYEFQRLKIYSGTSPLNDIYPTLLRENSYVFLGNTTVRDDLATFSYKGNLVTYRYPTGFLTMTKDLLFSDGGAEVYR
jgi:uncharacterized membrane protein